MPSTATQCDPPWPYSAVSTSAPLPSPLQILTGEVSPACDVFSLGMVLLQLMTGISQVLEVHDLLDSCLVGPARLLNLTRATKIFSDQLDENAGGGTRVVLWDWEPGLLSTLASCVGSFPMH